MEQRRPPTLVVNPTRLTRKQRRAIMAKNRRADARDKPRVLLEDLRGKDPRTCLVCHEIMQIVQILSEEAARIHAARLPKGAVFDGVPTCFAAKCQCGFQGLQFTDHGAALRELCPDVPGWPELPATPPAGLAVEPALGSE